MPLFTDWIDRLELLAHPEGGFWAPAHQATEQFRQEHLPARYAGGRTVWSSIYFMVTHDSFSAFHRLQTDELWHFYDGVPLTLHLLFPDGAHQTIELGLGIGARPQLLVPRGCWFAAEVTKEGGFTLCGCTLSPGFDFADFELAQRNELTQTFPAHKTLIHRLTRQ